MFLFIVLAFNTAFADDTKVETTNTASSTVAWSELTNAELRREVKTTDTETVGNEDLKALVTEFKATCTNRFSSECSDNLNRLRLAMK